MLFSINPKANKEKKKTTKLVIVLKLFCKFYVGLIFLFGKNLILEIVAGLYPIYTYNPFPYVSLASMCVLLLRVLNSLLNFNFVGWDMTENQIQVAVLCLYLSYKYDIKTCRLNVK